MIEQFRRRMLGPRTEIEGYPEFRYNYILGIINGVLFNSGLSFFHYSTVIPKFLDSLGAPSVLISLTALLESLGWHLPQLLASKFIIHKSRKMPLYAWACVIRVAGLALSTSAAYMARTSPGLALGLFVLGYSIFAIAGGFAGLVFTEILAKTVPKEKRGSYFGWRAILSGIIGLYLGVSVIQPIIKTIEYPYSYVTIFAIGSILIAISLYLFTRQREPEQRDLPPKRTLAEQLAAAWRILLTDRAFRRFIIFRGLMMLWFAGIPFYTLLAIDKIGAKEPDIGLFVSWDCAGLIVANILWGYLSNRVGNRNLLVIACSLGLVVSVGAVMFATGYGHLPFWSFGFIFFLSAAVISGVGNGGLNYALEIVPEAERPTYVGLMNSLLAIALAIAGLVGLVRDFFGYTGLYVMTGIVALASLLFILRLPEPRRQRRADGV